MTSADDITWELAPTVDGEIPVDETDVATVAIIEAESYRALAQQALHLLHDVTLERDVLREQRAIDRRREREAV